MALKHLDKMSPRMKQALCGKCVMVFSISSPVKHNKQQTKEEHRTGCSKRGNKNA